MCVCLHVYVVCVAEKAESEGMGDMTLLVRYERDKTRGAGKLEYCGELR